MTIHQLKTQFVSSVSKIYTASETALLFKIFCEKILNLSRIQIRNGELEIEEDDISEFHAKLRELQAGKPYQHIFGETDFFGRTFFVNENVLIPRPETEELLELAIKTIQNSKLKIQNLKILDIGTGSGVIPIILKTHFPEAEVWAMDISAKALETARKNAVKHQTEIHFVQADYLNTEIEEKFDVLISNPPYIGQNEHAEISHGVKDFEPDLALFSPTEDSLIFYRKIAADARHCLNENGLVFLEINQKYGKETLALFRDFPESRLIKDISGNERFVVAGK